MSRILLLLAIVFFSSGISAAERLYIDTSYEKPDGKSVQYNLACRDSKCTTHSGLGNGSFTLSNSQREQILRTLQLEVDQFAFEPTPDAENRFLKIGLKYTSARQRIEVIRHLPADRLTDISPELTALIRIYLGQDLSTLEITETNSKKEKPRVPLSQQF